MRTITIGIMPQKKMRARALAIAKGQRKRKPGEPKIWFPSMRSVAEVLSDENRALLRVIRESQPQSIGELSQLTGRLRALPKRASPPAPSREDPRGDR